MNIIRARLVHADFEFTLVACSLIVFDALIQINEALVGLGVVLP